MSMTLPSLTVPDRTGQRVMRAFSNDVKQYRAWLKDALRAHVASVEIRVADETANQTKQQLMYEILQDLDAPDTP